MVIALPAVIALSKKWRNIAAAKRTYLILKDGLVCGVPFLKNGGGYVPGQYFELSCRDIVSVHQTNIDVKSNIYTTLQINTNSARYDFAVDNSQEAVFEIRKKISR